MDFLSDLNAEQREAVLQTDGPLLILAGAGSGKTRVIAYRIAYLIGSALAQPGEVLAVTFTNKAADEMRARVERLLGAECAALWLSTFHALCARLLRRDAPAIGLSRDFVIYDSADQLAAVRQALRELAIDERLLQPRVALARISHAKNRMETPAQIRAAGWSHRDEELARIYERYNAILAASSALDFDDLLLRTVDLLEHSESTRERYARRFRHVMVDEYQDTNRPQYLLVRRLSQVHRNLCVVGDPDQSIYRWRGADLRNILDFERDFPEARIVKLERNYRSTQVILDAATAVIRQNRNRKDKRLWTDRDGGARILYFRGTDELEEADFITRALRTALNEGMAGPLAALYRTNAQSRVIEDALRREGLAYKIIGGVRFYERKEIKDALAYLKLVINPHDDVSLRRVINVPARGIGKGVMEGVEAIDVSDQPERKAEGGRRRAAGGSLWAKVAMAVDHSLLPARAVASLRAFRDLILTITEIARQDSVSIALGKVLDRSGYLQDLREDRSEDADARIENLMELVSAAREYEQRDAEASLRGFVDQLSLLSETDEEEGARDAQVWLMTMHAAKGLEFPVVVMAGLEEGLFPHVRATTGEEDDIEEERRLCYVGMTRAQARLILTGAARRRVFGEYQGTDPSRFVDEVPAELMERLAADVAAPYQAVFHHPHYEFRTNPYRRRGSRVREAEGRYAYEDEDQSAGAGAGLRPGARVRHSQFGVGTVVSVEPLTDDVKLIVRFANVGRKTLRAKYARLEVV